MTGTQKFHHITPVLRKLHWLPVRQRIKYKLAMIVYKCLHGLAPVYLVSHCQAISAIASKRQLRSPDTGTLFVPRTTTLRCIAEQSASLPSNRNALTYGIRSTCSTGMDSASEDYLGRALQICTSSSSSTATTTITSPPLFPVALC